MCVCYELLLDLVEESMDLAMESSAMSPHMDTCDIAEEREIHVDSNLKDGLHLMSEKKNDIKQATDERSDLTENHESSIIDISVSRANRTGQFIADPGSAFTPAIDLLPNKEKERELETEMQIELKNEKISNTEGKNIMSGKERAVTFEESVQKSSKSNTNYETHEKVQIEKSNDSNIDIEEEGKDGEESLVLSVSIPPANLGAKKAQKTDLGPDSRERTPSPLSPESCFTLADNVM